MQLIMSTDIDIGIKSMSSINQESLREKTAASNLVQELIKELTNGNKDNIEQDKENLIELNDTDLIKIKEECSAHMTKDENSSEFKDDENAMDKCTSTDKIQKQVEYDDDTDLIEEQHAAVLQIKNDMEIDNIDAAEDNEINSVLDSEKSNEFQPNEDEIELIDDTNAEDVKEINEINSVTDLTLNGCLINPENDVKDIISCKDIDTEPSEKLDDSNSRESLKIADSIQQIKKTTEIDDDIISCQDISTDAANEIDIVNNDLKMPITEEQSLEDAEIEDDIISYQNVIKSNDKIENVVDLEKDDQLRIDDDVITCQNIEENEEIESADEDIILCEESPKQPDNLNAEESVKELEETKTVNENCIKPSENKVIENEVIDIADEKPIEDIAVSPKSTLAELDNIVDVDNYNSPSTTGVEIIETKIAKSPLNENSSNYNKINAMETECATESAQNNTTESNSSDKVVLESNNVPITENTTKEKKKFSLISKLSNTLDILSDEDEEVLSKPESPKVQEVPTSPLLNTNLPTPIEKQCVNIEYDDDIMLIDDEATTKDSESVVSDIVPEKETKISADVPECHSQDVEIKTSEQNETTNYKESLVPCPDTINKTTEVEEEKVAEHKPLLPGSFLKTCKKKLSDMTRDELEEFCIVKIVESVVDRSNLGEIKSQLKTLAQSIEEYRKKAMTLTKQNRDLQVVLKSVQEEQKKNTDAPISPLKITRSVGMQVLMTTEKVTRRKSTNVGGNSNVNVPLASVNRQPKAPAPQNRKSGPIQIPVPRLVPAGNNTNVKSIISPIHQNTNNSVKPIQRTNSMPNGIKNPSSTIKSEKRPHEKLQQSNSVTVDLTDDEPPTKIPNRNASVRCVPPQNLFTPRQALSNPRKVYIPISGPSNQNIRPGQTIMLRSVPPLVNQTRPKAMTPKMLQYASAIRMGRVSYQHPAPLPENTKQYQPPNWKSLPPAPDVKLSKVEHGIVVSWKIEDFVKENHEEIASYQLYAYHETSAAPCTSLWKKIGDVTALPLPMACTLTQFMAGNKYHFAVRAIDIKSRFGPFSVPESIRLIHKS